MYIYNYKIYTLNGLLVGVYAKYILSIYRDNIAHPTLYKISVCIDFVYA